MRLIDGDKLANWMKEFPETTNENGIRHLERGRFDILSDQGEAAKLREAIKEAMAKEWELAGEPTPVYTILHQALSSHEEDAGIQKVQGIEWIPFVPQVAREKIEENDYLIFYNDRICQATHDAMSGFFYRESAAGMVIYPYRSISHYAEFNVPGITDGGKADETSQ